MSPSQQQVLPLLAGMAVVLLVTFLMVVGGIRRVVAIRRQMVGLSEEHERLFVHAQTRMAAQKKQALAEQASGDERREHLAEALVLWRQAMQTRDPKDAYSAEFIDNQIAMIEQDLAEA
jgi:hypothetical protein